LENRADECSAWPDWMIDEVNAGLFGDETKVAYFAG
jgi:hypothetical protein